MKEQVLLIVIVLVKRGPSNTCALADEVRSQSGVPAFEHQLIECLDNPGPGSSGSFIFRLRGHRVSPFSRTLEALCLVSSDLRSTSLDSPARSSMLGANQSEVHPC